MRRESHLDMRAAIYGVMWGIKFFLKPEGFLVCGPGGGGREGGEYLLCFFSETSPVSTAEIEVVINFAWWVDVIGWERGEDWVVVGTKRGHGMPVQDSGEVGGAER